MGKESMEEKKIFNPLRVRIVEEPPKPRGIIEELPKPKKIEKPKEAEILSQYSGKAHYDKSEKKSDKPGVEKPFDIPVKPAPEIRGGKSPSPKTEVVIEKEIAPKKKPVKSVPEKKEEEIEKVVPSTKVLVKEKKEIEKIEPSTKVIAKGRKEIKKETREAKEIMDAEEIIKGSREVKVAEKTVQATREAEKNRQETKEAVKKEKTGDVLKREATLKRETKPSPLEKEQPKTRRGLPLLSATDLRKYTEINPGERGEGSDREAVSLNTKEFKFLSYFASIKRKIELVWSYPMEAQEEGIHGYLFLRFTILKDGRLEKVVLLQSSGHKILDDEAIHAIKTAAPFNPIPERLKMDKITIEASFHYLPRVLFVR
jgi:TonB family protein